MIEFFVTERVLKDGARIRDLYQVFEFIQGISLKKCILELRSKPETFDWAARVSIARVMMYGIECLHKVGVVHTDLKPENIFLMPKSGMNQAYVARIIDLDYSIIADKRPPWVSDDDGCVGTEGYMSPEHYQGQIPIPASDVFTCGIMLSELLGQGNPFTKPPVADDVIKGRFRPIVLQSGIDKAKDKAFVEVVLNACLAPKPADRPTAKQVKDALNGKLDNFAGRYPNTTIDVSTLIKGNNVPPESAPTPSVPVHKEPSTPSAQPAKDKNRSIDPNAETKKNCVVEFTFENKKKTVCRINMELGRRKFQGWHEDVEYMSSSQFKIYRDAGGVWMIAHCSSAANMTMINGRALDAPIPIENGMRVTVGNEKFPLVLTLKEE
jgi:serine/threonine protein kinase